MNNRIDKTTKEGLTRPPFNLLQISSYSELLKNEKVILRRIEEIQNGGNLFMIHPFMLFDDIGVKLSKRAKADILSIEPGLASLSEVPYQALKSSQSQQNYHIHLKGLFKRRRT